VRVILIDGKCPAVTGDIPLELVVDLEETELAEATRGLIPGYEEKRERAADGMANGAFW